METKVRGDDFLEKRFILRMIRREFKNDAKGYRIDYDITEFANDPDAPSVRTQRKILDRKVGSRAVLNVVQILDESQYIKKEKDEAERLGHENYYVMIINPDAFHEYNEEYGLNRLDDDSPDWNEIEYMKNADEESPESNKVKEDDEQNEEDVAFKIVYTKDRRVLIEGKEIKKFEWGSENSIIFEQLYNNPNKPTKINSRRSKHELVSSAFGFRGNARKLFFDVVGDTITFHNPVYKQDLTNLGMEDMTIEELWRDIS